MSVFAGDRTSAERLPRHGIGRRPRKSDLRGTNGAMQHYILHRTFQADEDKAHGRPSRDNRAPEAVAASRRGRRNGGFTRNDGDAALRPEPGRAADAALPALWRRLRAAPG